MFSEIRITQMVYIILLLYYYTTGMDLLNPNDRFLLTNVLFGQSLVQYIMELKISYSTYIKKTTKTIILINN